MYHDNLSVAVGIAVSDKVFVTRKGRNFTSVPAKSALPMMIATSRLPGWPQEAASHISSSREQRRVHTGRMSSIVRAADAGEGIKNGSKDSKHGSLRESSKNTYSSTSLHEYGGDQVQREGLGAERLSNGLLILWQNVELLYASITCCSLLQDPTYSNDAAARRSEQAYGTVKPTSGQ